MIVLTFIIQVQIYKHVFKKNESPDSGPYLSLKLTEFSDARSWLYIKSTWDTGDGWLTITLSCADETTDLGQSERKPCGIERMRKRLFPNLILAVFLHLALLFWNQTCKECHTQLRRFDFFFCKKQKINTRTIAVFAKFSQNFRINKENGEFIRITFFKCPLTFYIYDIYLV